MVLPQITHQLFAYPNVHTVGEGIKLVGGKPTGQWSVIAFVDRKLEIEAMASKDIIPASIRDERRVEIPTDVVEKGWFWKLQGSGPTPSAPQHQVKIRPVVAGISTSAYSVSGTGTICSLQMRDRLTGKRVGISNNHVWAGVNALPIGKLIQQPGVADKQADVSLEIGKLLRFVPIKLIQASARPPGAPPVDLWNWVDLSVMEFILEDAEYSQDTLEAGKVLGTKVITGNEIALDKVAKGCHISGRSSGFPTTYPTAVNVSSWIFYTQQMVSFFVFNVMTPDYTVKPGDSGSPLIWNNGNLLSGLTYAGTQQGAGLHNSIDQVLEKGQLEFLLGPGDGGGKKYGRATTIARYTVTTEGSFSASIIFTLEKRAYRPGELVKGVGVLKDTDSTLGISGRVIDWEDTLASIVPLDTGETVTDAQGTFAISFMAGAPGNHVLTIKFQGDP